MPHNLRPSAIDAYRQSLPGGQWEAPTPSVATWIRIATLLHAGSAGRTSAERDALVEHCSRIARESTSDAYALEATQDPHGIDSPTAVLRGLAEHVVRYNQIHLGAHMLSSLYDLYASDAIESSRILALLRVVATLTGQEEISLARSRRLFATASQLRHPELLYKAWTGLVSYFYARGNLPRMAIATRRALKYAERIGTGRLIALALSSRSAALGLSGDYGQAVADCWRGLTLTDHPQVRVQLLGNAAETLYRGGHWRASRAARAAILTHRLEPDPLLVILGGYAVTCSALGDVAGVRWAADQALAFTSAHRFSRGGAQGLLGCAQACGEVGLYELAATLYTRGMAIAEANGYHDLRFRPEPAKQPRKAQLAEPFRGDAANALRRIEDLAPDGVAADLVLAVNQA